MLPSLTALLPMHSKTAMLMVLLCALLPATAQQDIPEALPAAAEAAKLPSLQNGPQALEDQVNPDAGQSKRQRIETLGDYSIVSRIRCVNGQMHEVDIDALSYTLSSDGSTIYMQINSQKRPFKQQLEFIITRDDGIQISSPDGKSSELVPGLQAASRNGKITRHLTLTANFLQIVEIAAHSSDVIITRAQRN